jgi:hypothetical protein
MKRLLCFFVWAFSIQPLSAGFFDDFEGDRLGNWWRVYVRGKGWTHNVRDSWINVTRVWTATIYLLADTPVFADAEVRARVRWEPPNGTGSQSLTIGFQVPEREDNVPLYGLTYFRDYSGSPNELRAWSWYRGILATIPVPSSGIYDLRIVRTRDQVDFYFNGDLFYSEFGAATDLVSKANIRFGGDGSTFGSLHVDYIRMVPEPLSLSSLGLLSLLTLRRRRKTFLK